MKVHAVDSRDNYQIVGVSVVPLVFIGEVVRLLAEYRGHDLACVGEDSEHISGVDGVTKVVPSILVEWVK